MGLPRFKRDIFEQEWEEAYKNPNTLITSGAVFSLRVCECLDKINQGQQPSPNEEAAKKAYAAYEAEPEGKKNLLAKVICQEKFEVRSEYLPTKFADDGLARCPAALYQGLDLAGKPQFRFVSICLLALPRLQRRNALSEERDRKDMELKRQIQEVRSKVYQSRSFPASLRAIIFERDGYCCQKCGQHRDELIKNGSHLQVDHKQAWEDGGETCYENGETLCRECNIAKHHTKKYLRAVATVGFKA